MTLAEGPHPFPFRTRQLSPPAPMVLRGRPRGRVGRRRGIICEPRIRSWAFLCLRWVGMRPMPQGFASLVGSPPLSHHGFGKALLRFDRPDVIGRGVFGRGRLLWQCRGLPGAGHRHLQIEPVYRRGLRRLQLDPRVRLWVHALEPVSLALRLVSNCKLSDLRNDRPGQCAGDQDRWLDYFDRRQPAQQERSRYPDERPGRSR